MEDSQARFRFGAELQDIVKQSVPKKSWRDLSSWREKLSWKTGYTVSAIMSFALMALFGALSLRLDNACFVQAPGGRCCVCIDIADPEQRLGGQTIRTHKTWNPVYYGIIMIVNSAFGISYVITALRNENKYLLFIMMVTQALEMCRGLVDIALDPPGEEAPIMRRTREVTMYIALVFMFISWVCMRPVYKMFGWKIFRRGGAKKSIREMYKGYQRFRALNLLDIQSSVLLYLIFILYFDIVRWNGGWVFVVMLLCDVQASRYMHKYLKRETLGGAIVSGVSKLFVVGWWIAVIAMYVKCYQWYGDSRDRTRDWWLMPRVPNLESVYDTYRGLECLAPETTHDAKTMEMALLNFTQALFCRLGSLLVTIGVCGNFGRGLRDVFYKRKSEDTGQHSEGLMEDGADDQDDSMTRFGGAQPPSGDPVAPGFSDEDTANDANA